MWRWLALLLFCLWPPGLAAQQATQTDDRDFLTAFLEDSLSDLGRKVTIEGFQGALSSRATFSRLTIADGAGVWLTVTDGALTWSRTALVTGRIEIDELSAASIEMTRRPRGPAAKVEAAPFALPELPVSVRIGKLTAARLHLGAPVLGQAAELAVDGKAELAGGEGSADLAIRRIDGKAGDLSLKAAFANATRMATVDLLVREGAGGIAANLLGLPGAPATQLALHGDGPLSDFSAELKLATDGQSRLAGRLHLGHPAGATGGQVFSLDLSGDIAPLLQPDYRAFFGENVALEAEGARRPDGRTDLTRLVLTSEGLDISGRLSLSAENIPLATALTLRFGLPDQSEMRLPLPGEPALVRHGTVLLRYDAGRGDQWSLTGDIAGFRRAGFSLDSLALTGGGRVQRAGTTARIFGTLGFDAGGIAVADPALAQAIGDRLTGQTVFSWQSGHPLTLRGLTAAARDLSLTGDLSLARAGLDLRASGTLSAAIPDLGRLAALAGLPLTGGADATLTGSALLLSRGFDLQAAVAGHSIHTGSDPLDRLLAGETAITASVLRDGTGLTLRSLALTGPGYRAGAQGSATSDKAELSAKLRAAGLNIGSPIADSLVAGESDLRLAARRTGGGTAATYVLTEAKFSNPQISLTLADPEATGTWQAEARLADVARLAPGLSGAASLKGTVARAADGYRLSLDGTGPGHMTARIAGRIAADAYSADLTAAGRIGAAALNRLIAPRSADGTIAFDLALKGPLAPQSLAGRVTAENLRVASPRERLSAAFPALTADLRDGRAVLSGRGSLRGGGEVALSGAVALARPFDADLRIGLNGARITDPNLYDTRLTGEVSVTGPILGGGRIAGAVTLDKTEITVAAAGFQDSPIPPIRHLGEGRASADTRRRAGLDTPAPAGPGAVFDLDLSISAPDRLFVRGRGLDAEMAGQMRLRGTTADMQPEGRFTLVRGRLNLLGKRFKLNEGLVQLQGSFVPDLSFSASADSFGATTSILLDGPANAPEVHFSSTTGRPEEEVLSELIFGNGFEKLSAFQLAQLANAVATISGRSGDLVARIRERLALDDLDITADDRGSASLKAGKYLGERLYSEATVGSDGKSKVELDLDLSPDLSLRGTAGTAGQTGVGLFYNHDY
ncbi:MAG: translocation/assembly module TamB domain-containing protein [Proteobacteria bacterium]|nr:translocation/assembly module TamB domain-containing protein [Pseudomonadota bacterium]MBS0573250.1 translocation/assembly module TamB domain-containing protein [Pseudomonadota bacterium]